MSRLFESVVVPRVVVQELSDPGASLIVRDWASQLPEWVVVQSPRTQANLWTEERRGRGERAAIALAKELGSPVLSDDRHARHLAQKAGLEVSGTLGVLQAAHAMGMDDIEQALAELAKTNFYLAERLIERTIYGAQELRLEVESRIENHSL